MTTLNEVKKWMQWWGWANGGNPGSVKVDAHGGIIARHGDATWSRDVEEACRQVAREREADEDQ